MAYARAEDQAQAHREWKARNVEHVRAYARAYRAAHPEIAEADRRRTRSAQKSRQRFMVSVKLTCGCVDCGYRANADALQFDHIEPRIRGAVGWQSSWKRMIEEMAICEIRCANCHAIVTAARREMADL